MSFSATGHLDAVSAIIVNPAGKVLLQLRDNFPHLLCPNQWTIPGGVVEEGETPEQAMLRELKEEMELEIPVRYWKVFEAWRGDADEINVTQHLFLAELDRPAEDIPLHEGQRLQYFGPGELAGLTIAFGHGPTLYEYFILRP
jgi:8-oxo-dGTP pyrophosphatase MutT (NUDIX family)